MLFISKYSTVLKQLIFSVCLKFFLTIIKFLYIEDLTFLHECSCFTEVVERDKLRGLQRILSLFRKEFNKFNNTRARILDSIYHKQ